VKEERVFSGAKSPVFCLAPKCRSAAADRKGPEPFLRAKKKVSEEIGFGRGKRSGNFARSTMVEKCDCLIAIDGSGPAYGEIPEISRIRRGRGAGERVDSTGCCSWRNWQH